MSPSSLEKFIIAQETNFNIAKKELTDGKKQTHWMWFIFPQIKGLGISEQSKYYAITSLNEAKAFLEHPVLGDRLRELCKILLLHRAKSAFEILGSPDDLKLFSCMTLFSEVSEEPIFKEVLDQFFEGKKDPSSLKLILRLQKNSG